jgi:small subunit ribosomal protein S11
MADESEKAAPAAPEGPGKKDAQGGDKVPAAPEAAAPADKDAAAADAKPAADKDAPAPEAKDGPARDKPADAASGAGEAPPAEADASAKPPEPARKIKGRMTRTSPMGVAHIKATVNNTMVSIADMNGGVVSWCSSGRAGFKGSRKSTAFAATMVGQDAARAAVGKGMREVEVRVQGAGSGRESAIRALQSAGLNISVIKDVTPIPHNGCRPRKKRRV